MSLNAYKLSKKHPHFTEKETEAWRSSANLPISDGEGISFFLSFLKYLFVTYVLDRAVQKDFQFKVAELKTFLNLLNMTFVQRPHVKHWSFLLFVWTLK